jgi:multiple sugar transport system substrate-binding protein
VIVASVPLKQDSAAMILKALPDARSFRIVPRQSDWDKAFYDQFQDPLFHQKGTAAELIKLAMPDLTAALAP